MMMNALYPGDLGDTIGVARAMTPNSMLGLYLFHPEFSLSQA
jgi:hypothetical protein